MRRFLRELTGSIARNGCFDHSAQLAYWMLLALFPFSIFVLTVIGFLPLGTADHDMLRSIYHVMPGDAARLVDETLREVLGRKRSGLLVVSLVGALWTGSGAISTLMTALNRAYGVVESRPAWKRRLEAALMALIAMLLTVVAVSAIVVGPEIAEKLSEWVGFGHAFEVAWRWVRWPIVVVAWMALLGLLYWVLPNTHEHWHLIAPGTVIGVALWIAASSAFRLYVRHFHAYARTYGTLGAAVVLLVWLYWSGLVVIVGGEINAALHRVRGR